MNENLLWLKMAAGVAKKGVDFTYKPEAYSNAAAYIEQLEAENAALKAKNTVLKAKCETERNFHNEAIKKLHLEIDENAALKAKLARVEALEEEWKKAGSEGDKTAARAARAGNTILRDQASLISHGFLSRANELAAALRGDGEEGEGDE